MAHRRIPASPRALLVLLATALCAPTTVAQARAPFVLYDVHWELDGLALKGWATPIEPVTLFDFAPDGRDTPGRWLLHHLPWSAAVLLSTGGYGGLNTADLRFAYATLFAEPTFERLRTVQNTHSTGVELELAQQLLRQPPYLGEWPPTDNLLPMLAPSWNDALPGRIQIWVNSGAMPALGHAVRDLSTSVALRVVRSQGLTTSPSLLADDQVYQDALALFPLALWLRYGDWRVGAAKLSLRDDGSLLAASVRATWSATPPAVALEGPPGPPSISAQEPPPPTVPPTVSVDGYDIHLAQGHIEVKATEAVPDQGVAWEAWEPKFSGYGCVVLAELAALTGEDDAAGRLRLVLEWQHDFFVAQARVDDASPASLEALRRRIDALAAKVHEAGFFAAAERIAAIQIAGDGQLLREDQPRWTMSLSDVFQVMWTLTR